MFEPPPVTPPPPPQPQAVTPEPRPAPLVWSTILAWIVILGASATFVFLHEDPEQGGAGSADEKDTLGVMLIELQAKYMVAAAELTSESAALVYVQAKPSLNAGSIDQRQRFVILAAHLAGPEEARELLQQLEDEMANPSRGEPVQFTPGQARLQRILQELYPAVEVDEELPGEDTEAAPTESTVQSLAGAATLSNEDRDFLVQDAGWFGRLALMSAGDADPALHEEVIHKSRRVMYTIFGVLGSAAVLGVLGFAGLLILLILAFQRRVQVGIGSGNAHHGLYAQTFAIWMVLFAGLLMLVPAVLGDAVGMLGTFVAFFGSLVALAWPVVRGVPWRRVRQDIGWTGGRGGVLEPLFGVAAYVMTLPILAAGIGVTLVFLLIDSQLAGSGPTFAPSGGPAHPVIAELADGSWWMRAQILALAVIAAPIVEETMFRGVLYRHLRDATASLGMIVSVLLGATINSLLFAAIHPQGWVAIPALMSLAIGMTLTREWRGSILPSMVLHGTSNGLMLTFLLLLIRS